MLASIHLGQWASYNQIIQPAFLNFLSSDVTKRIKDVAIAIFSKVSAFLKSFNNQSSEINIKGIAMISCLCLVTLLVISILRRRDAGFVLPRGSVRMEPIN